MWQKARIRTLAPQEAQERTDDPLRPGTEFWVLVGPPCQEPARKETQRESWVIKDNTLISCLSAEGPDILRYETNIVLPNGYYARVSSTLVELLPEFMDDMLVPNVMLEELALAEPYDEGGEG